MKKKDNAFIKMHLNMWNRAENSGICARVVDCITRIYNLSLSLSLCVWQGSHCLFRLCFNYRVNRPWCRAGEWSGWEAFHEKRCFCICVSCDGNCYTSFLLWNCRTVPKRCACTAENIIYQMEQNSCGSFFFSNLNMTMIVSEDIEQIWSHSLTLS